MNTDEEELACRVARRLDQGLTGIDQRTLARLRSARESALERLAAQPAWALASAHGAVPPLGGNPMNSFTLRRFASIGALIAVICGMVYWQHLQHEDPLDIDAKLLSGDLPIDAYLDKGLDAWLTR
jgi:hypothetical protein